MAGSTEGFRDFRIRESGLQWGVGRYLFAAANLFLLVIGCAPTLYSVNMQYVPIGSISAIEKPSRPIDVTVAAFEDIRNVNDTTKIGQVVKLSGEAIPVFPKFVRPSRVVTDALKGLFKKTGYNVSPENPPWDLKEASIVQEGSPILIGGSIDELEVLCVNSLAKKEYTAKAKLTILVADRRTGRIIYRITTSSSTSLEHLLFSEEIMEEQINAALSAALEKIFEDKTIANVIRTSTGH